MDNLKTIFVNLYGDQLKKPNTTVVECHKFDDYFDQQLKELEGSGSKGLDHSQVLEEEVLSSNLGDEPPLPPGLTFRGKHADGAKEESGGETTPVGATPTTSRPSTPGGASHLITAKSGPLTKMSRRARKAQNSSSAPASSGDEAVRKNKATKSVKKGRKWDADGLADEDDDVQLDYSIINAPSDGEVETTARSTALDAVDSSTWGSKSKGKFILKDLDDEVHSILASAEKKSTKAKGAEPTSGLIGSGLSSISGMIRNLVGGKTLTKEDLEKAMKSMEDHLLKKNVAREAAVRLCEGVEKELVGVTTGNFESKSMELHEDAKLTTMKALILG